MYTNKIKMYREEKGISMKELADKCKISVGYLSHLEHGSRNNPSIEVMDRIAKALNMTIAQIFFSM